MFQWGGTGAFIVKNSDTTSWAQTFFTNCTCSAQIAPSFVQKWSKTHPNTMKRTKTWALVPMGWVRCVRCKNVRRDFVGRTFSLIAAIQAIFHWVLCSNETIKNAPKHYETHKNMSLGSNGLDLLHSLRKIQSQLHGTNFCTNCTASTQFAPCFVR